MGNKYTCCICHYTYQSEQLVRKVSGIKYRCIYCLNLDDDARLKLYANTRRQERLRKELQYQLMRQQIMGKID